jgi:hypothetical protein
MMHSKAPWSGGGEVVMDATGREVCTVNRKRKGSTSFVPIGQWKADSRIIAAAPLLYACMSEFLLEWRELGSDGDVNGADLVDWVNTRIGLWREAMSQVEGKLI